MRLNYLVVKLIPFWLTAGINDCFEFIQTGRNNPAGHFLFSNLWCYPTIGQEERKGVRQ